MAKRKATRNADVREETVKRYFDLVASLRKGDEKAVDGLMELWHPKGVFEFAGAPPLAGTFSGAMAIRTLYQNRLDVRRKKLPLDRGEDVRLGVVDTAVLKTSVKGGKLVAGWRTTIGTAQNQGFDESGSHEFTFQAGKIKALKVRVVGKPKKSVLSSLSLEDLSVRDIGRLSLAAWPVVC